MANDRDQKQDHSRALYTTIWSRTMQDLQYGLRQFARTPAFTAVAVLVLALGIVANTAIFSFLDAVMLRSLPVGNPEQLIVPKWTARETPHPFNVSAYEPCFASRAQKTEGSCSFTYPVFKLIQVRSDLFESATALAGATPVNGKASGPAAHLWVQIVDGTFFKTLRVHMTEGRPFLPEDDADSSQATGPRWAAPCSSATLC